MAGKYRKAPSPRRVDTALLKPIAEALQAGLNRPRVFLWIALLGLSLGSTYRVYAEGVVLPHVFQNGQVADADEVNANFSALANALDVTVPQTFVDSQISDADDINSNFTALKEAVDLFTGWPFLN